MKRTLILVLMFFTVTLFPQSAQWNSFLYYNPTPTSFFSVWQNNKNEAYIIVNYTGTARAEYVVKYVLKNSSGKTLATIISPTQVFEAGPGTKTFFADEFLAWSNITYDNTTLQQIIRTNRFPEGDYEGTVTFSTKTGTKLTESTGAFTIIYPDAPALIDPQNSSTEERLSPIFTWTTVNLPPSVNFYYKLRIVKRLPGQSNTQAIERNPAHHEDSTSNITTYVYPLSALPFENGAEYVWSIRVVDGQGNSLTSNDGNSEYWSFIYNSPGSPGFRLPFSSVELERNVAWFDDFSNTQLTSNENYYSLNGTTTLKVRFDDGVIREFPATVQNLTFQKNQYVTFNFSSGRVISQALNPDAIPASIKGNYFDAQTIEFDTEQKVVVKGQINIPTTGTPITKSVVIPVKAGGVLRGEFVSENQNNEPLISFGNPAVRVNLNGYKISFPGGNLTFNGEIRAFNSEVLKTFDGLTINSSNELTGSVETTDAKSIALVANKPQKYSLKFSGTAGSFSYNLGTGVSSINVSLSQPKLAFNNTDMFSRAFEGSIGFSASLTYASTNPMAEGLGISSIGTITLADGSALNANPMRFGNSHEIILESMRLDTLSAKENGIDFKIRVSFKHLFPGLNLSTALFEEVLYTKSGIAIPGLYSQELVSTTPAGSIRVLDGFNFNFKSVTATQVLWNGGNAPFDALLNVILTLPNLPQGSSSGLFSLEIPQTARLTKTGFTMNIDAVQFNDQYIALPSDMRFILRGLKGSVTGVLNNNAYEITSALNSSGRLYLPTGKFGCNDAQTLDLATSQMRMDGYGRITGKARNISNTCPPISVGLFPLTASQITVDLVAENDSQKVLFSGTGSMDLAALTGTTANANVNFIYSPVEDQWKSFTGSYSGQAALNIPRQNPFFQLNVNSIQVTADGLKINGRHSVTLDGQPAGGVTVSNAVFKFSDATMEGGSYWIDNGFALSVDISEGQNSPKLAFKPNSISSFPAFNGAYIRTKSNLQFTERRFFFLSGPNDTAFLNYNGNQYKTLVAANGGPRLAMGATGALLTSGTIDLTINGTICAKLSRGKFTVFEEAFPSLPEQLNLVASNIGTIKIKDDTGFLVDYTVEGSNFRVKSKPGQKVKAVFPVLNFITGISPELEFTMDVLVDKSSGDIAGGSITTDIPADKLEEFNLTRKDIPAKLKNMSYTKNQSTGQYELKFGSVLMVFGEEINSQLVNLTITSLGELKSDMLDNLSANKTFNLRSGDDADKLVIQANTVSGWIGTSLRPFTTPYYSLVVKGGIKLKLFDNSYKGANAVFYVSHNSVQPQNLIMDNFTSAGKFDLGNLKFDISSLTLPVLSYDKTSGWDYKLVLNAKYNITANGLTFNTPPVEGIAITKRGITLPIVQMNNLENVSETFTVSGFPVKTRNFRADSLTIASLSGTGVNVNNLGFRFDFSVLLSGFPSYFPNGIRNAKLSIQNASLVNGFINSNSTDVSTLQDNKVNINNASGYQITITRLTGKFAAVNGAQSFSLKVASARSVWPYALSINNSVAASSFKPSSEVYLNGNGIFTGVGVLQPAMSSNAPPKIGYSNGTYQFAPTNAHKIYFYNQDGQKIVLTDSSNNAQLTIPKLKQSQNPNNAIAASGVFAIDLVNQEVITSNFTFNNFRFALPEDGSSKLFDVEVGNSGKFENGSFKISGQGNLVGENDKKFSGNFQDLNLQPGFDGIQSGTFTPSQPIGIYITPNNGWALCDTGKVPTVANSIVIRTNGLSLNSLGLSVTSPTLVNIRYENQDYKYIRLVKEGNPHLRVSSTDKRLVGGKLKFMDGNTEIGFIDSTGISLTNMPVTGPPDQLVLGDIKNAYLVLKNGSTELVQWQAVSDGIRIQNKPGQTVKLVAPGLKYDQQAAPEFNLAQLDVVINKTTMAIVSGSVTLVPPQNLSQLIDLSDRGIPLKVTKLEYKSTNLGYILSVDGKTALPGVLANLETGLTDIRFSNGKLTGFANNGNYSVTSAPDAGYKKIANAGTMATFKMQGVEYTFGENASYKISGDITSKLFKKDNDTSIVHFTAAFENNNFVFSATSASSEGLNIGKLKLVPQSVGTASSVALTFTNDDFSLVFNGVMKAPGISSDFETTIEDLTVNKSGVVNSTVSAEQEFTLFAMGFSLAAVKYSYANDAFTAGLDGKMNFMDMKDVSFTNLQVSSAGTISFAAGSGFQGVSSSTPVDVLEGRFNVKGLSLATENNETSLKVSGDITLPEPVKKSVAYNFDIPADQSKSSDETYTLINEAPGIGGNDQTETAFWGGKYDVQYIGLKIDFEDFTASEILLTSRFYVDGVDPLKYIKFGDQDTGGEVEPGLTMAFDNSNSWTETLDFSNKCDFEYKNLKYDLQAKDLTFDTLANGGFKLKIAGEVGIAMTGKFSGKLTFSGLTISSNNRVDSLVESITGGSLTIDDKINVTVSRIGFSSSPTFIYITDPSGKKVTTAGPDSGTYLVQKVEVNFYFIFGGSMSLGPSGSPIIEGSVDSILVYRKRNADGSDGDINFKIASLKFEKADMFKFTLNMMLYTDAATKSSLFALSGNVEAGNFAMVLAGKFGTINGELTAGIFVAVQKGLRLQIGPVTIVGFGAGFFWKPTEEDLKTVKKLCNFEDTYTSGLKEKVAAQKPEVEDPTFAVFIYGSAEIGRKELIWAQILITVTDKQLNLDGRADMLDKPDEIYGLISIEIGFKEFYAEGYIEVNMKLGNGKLMEGGGKVDFWFYSTNNWGILGTFEFKLAGGIVKANGDFYAGSKGLYVSLDITQSIDVWIIAIKSGIQLKAWYQPNVSWGAYFSISVDVSVLGGIASAGGTIKGVLLGKPKFALAGVASLRVRLLMVSWDGDVWMRIEDGGFRAGFGKDEAVQRLIDKADKAAKAMLASLEEAKADMKANKPVPSLSLSPQVINAASDELFKIALRARVLTAGDKLTQAEKDSIIVWVTSEGETVNNGGSGPKGEYLNALISKILDKSETREAHRTEITTLLNEMNSAINDYKTEVNKISTALSGYILQVEAPGEFNTNNISDPVSNVSFVKPDTNNRSPEPQPGAAGFSLNSGAADANTQAMNTYITAALNYHDMLKSNMEKIETSIKKFDETFKASGNTYLSVTDKYVALEAKVRKFTERLADYHFDDHKAISMFFTSPVSTYFESKPDDLFSERTSGSWYSKFRNKREESYRRWARARALSKSITTPWDWPAFKKVWEAENYNQTEGGAEMIKNLYYTIPKNAFATLDGEVMQNLFKVREEYKTKMQQINELAVAYTRLLDDLFAKRRAMSESLFELTERFIYWKDQPKKDTRDITDYKTVAPTLQDLNTKRSGLVASNTAPELTLAPPTWVNKKAYTWLSVSWNATHANGIVDYAVYADPSSTFSFGLRAGTYEGLSSPISIGNKQGIIAIGFPSANQVITDNIDFVVRARSYSGYTITRRLNIAGGVQRGFTSETMNQPITTVQGTVTSDNTPPEFTSARAVDLVEYDADSFRFTDFGGTYGGPVRHYGTKMLNEIKVKLAARDNESGIKRYEYRIDLMRYSTGPGGRQQLDLVSTVRDWTNIGLVENYLIQGLNLQHNKVLRLGETPNLYDESTRYVVRFRVYNGSDRVNDNGFIAFAVFADTSKPAPVIFHNTGLPYTTARIDPMQNQYSPGSIAKVSVPLPAFIPDTTTRKIYFRFRLPEGYDGLNIKNYFYRVYGMPDEIPVSTEAVRDKLLAENDNQIDKVVILPNSHSNYSGYKILLRYEEKFGGVSPVASTEEFHSGKADNAARVGTSELELKWFTGIPPGYSGDIPGGNVNLYFYKLAGHPDGIKKYQYQIRKDNGGEFGEWRDLPEIPADRILRLDPVFFQGSGINSGDSFTLRIRYVTYSNFTTAPLWYQSITR